MTQTVEQIIAEATEKLTATGASFLLFVDEGHADKLYARANAPHIDLLKAAISNLAQGLDNLRAEEAQAKNDGSPLVIPTQEEKVGSFMRQHNILLRSVKAYCTDNSLSALLMVSNHEVGTCLWDVKNERYIPAAVMRTLEGLRLMVSEAEPVPLPPWLRLRLASPTENEFAEKPQTLN